MQDAVETVVEQQVTDAQPVPESPKTVSGEDMAAGGNQWDGDKNQFVNKTPREENGRFAKVRASLEASQKTSEYKKTLLDGFVDPDESMDPETWAMARNAQIRSKAGQITPPDFGAEKVAHGAEAAQVPAAEQPTPEQIAQRAAHEDLMTKIWVRFEEPEVASLSKAMTVAAESGATPAFFDALGRTASGQANAEEVLFHLGSHPEKMVAYSFMNPAQLETTIRALASDLATRSKKASAPAQPKPKPPDPVGARATATAFDPNDENMSADEWASQRNKQLADRRAARR